MQKETADEDYRYLKREAFKPTPVCMGMGGVETFVSYQDVIVQKHALQRLIEDYERLRKVNK